MLIFGASFGFIAYLFAFCNCGPPWVPLYCMNSHYILLRVGSTTLILWVGFTALTLWPSRTIEAPLLCNASAAVLQTPLYCLSLSCCVVFCCSVFCIYVFCISLHCSPNTPLLSCCAGTAALLHRERGLHQQLPPFSSGINEPLRLARLRQSPSHPMFVYFVFCILYICIIAFLFSSQEKIFSEISLITILPLPSSPSPSHSSSPLPGSRRRSLQGVT